VQSFQHLKYLKFTAGFQIQYWDNFDFASF